DDFRAVAVLDLTSGAHHGVVRTPAGQWCGERPHHRAWIIGPPAETHLLAFRHHRGDDPYPVALHALADLQRNEDDLADLHAGGEVPGSISVLRIPAGLHAADTSGRGGRLPAHFHPQPRILYYAGPGWWADRPDGLRFHRRRNQSRE